MTLPADSTDDSNFHSMVNPLAQRPQYCRVGDLGIIDQQLFLRSQDQGRELLTLSGHTQRVTSVAFSSDGKRIVTGSVDKKAVVTRATTA